MFDGEIITVIKNANVGLTCVNGEGAYAGWVYAVLKIATMSPEGRRQLGHSGRQYAPAGVWTYSADELTREFVAGGRGIFKCHSMKEGLR